MTPMADKRWAADPLGRHEFRYWDGTKWTGHVANAGAASFDDAGLPVLSAQTPRRTSVLTALRKTTYLGSHPAVSGQAEGIDVEFTETAVTFRAKRDTLGSLEWSQIVRLAADDRDAVESRLTASRLVLLGAFALLAKKQTALSFLVITDDRGEWIFSVPGLTAIELDSGLRQLQRLVPTRPSERTIGGRPEGDSVRMRLERLNELFEDGVIDEAEHLAGRRTILGDV